MPEIPDKFPTPSIFYVIDAVKRMMMRVLPSSMAVTRESRLILLLVISLYQKQTGRCKL